jgi:cell division protein FtsZ
MGVGSATGKDKAEQAAKKAISSPLLETSIKGATGILINISASPEVGLEDVDLAATMVSNEASPDANVIWGVAFDDSLDDEIRITIIATGFDRKPDDPYYKNQAAIEPPVRSIPVIEEIPVVEEKKEPEVVAAPVVEPVVEVKPEPVKPVKEETSFENYWNDWDVFRRK